MSKWEICVAWLVILAIGCVIWTAPKYVCPGEGARLTGKYFNPDRAMFINWSIVLQRVLLIVLVGIGLILPGRRRKKEQ